MATAEHTDPPGGEKPIGELLSDLTRQVTSLVHDEVELATAELKEKGKRAGVGTGLLGGAGVAGLFGLACATACVIGALQIVLPVWLACLVVAVGYLAIAGGAALAGKRELKRAAPPVPTAAIQDTKEEVAWLTTQARSASN